MSTAAARPRSTSPRQHLLLIALLALTPAAVLAQKAKGKGAQAPRGEMALRASFYLNTIPTLVELVGEVKPDVLDALELDPKRRAIVEKAIADVWTEQRLYANAAAALEKQVPPKALEAALAKMTPEIQSMIRSASTEAVAPEKAQTLLEKAQKQPDAKVREALARRIAAHMPSGTVFSELAGQIAEVLADVAQVSTGDDAMRAELAASLQEGLAPAVEAMNQPDVMVMSVVAGFADTSTEQIQALADALDSEAGRTLQRAAAPSILAGAKQTRKELVARLKKELPPAAQK